MYLSYDEGNGGHIVFYEEEDKCRFCKHLAKCPLISALQLGEYCIPIREKIPTQDFCELFEANPRIKSMQKSLEKRKKSKD